MTGSFFRTRSARILTVVLLGQASLFYGFSRRETVPQHAPLADFQLPASSPWAMRENMQLDPDTLEVLKADDLTSRVYQNTSNGAIATLFVAFFETQRTGKAPHSPKNCLPGSGWTPSRSSVRTIPIPGSKPISVNDYVISRGQNQSIVLYWYQSRDRVVASEYSAKIFTVTDAIRYNRSDTALVRVVVNVADGNVEAAEATAVSFVQSFFTPLRDYLPA
jgi:EpsI family protein